MIRYTMELTPLGALHIGTGNVLSPLEYTIKEDQFVRFSLERLVSSLSEQKRKELLQRIDGNNLKDVIVFVQENITEESILYRYRADKDFIHKFNSKLADPENQLLVYEMYKDPLTFEPIIPGSSIKGALRTAIVNTFAESQRSRWENYFLEEKDALKNIEKKVLGYKDAKEDPFRYIRVSDCRVGEKQCVRVGDVVNYNPSDESDPFRSMQIIGEYITGLLYEKTMSYRFYIEEDDQLARAKKRDRNKETGEIERFPQFRKVFSLHNELKNIHDFYKRRFEKEYEKFYVEAEDKNVNGMGVRLQKEINNMQEGCFLIRLGRYSHIESMTLDLREFVEKNKYGEEEYNENPPNGKTRMLTKAHHFAFGWAKLRIVDIKKV